MVLHLSTWALPLSTHNLKKHWYLKSRYWYFWYMKNIDISDTWKVFILLWLEKYWYYLESIETGTVSIPEKFDTFHSWKVLLLLILGKFWYLISIDTFDTWKYWYITFDTQERIDIWTVLIPEKYWHMNSIDTWKLLTVEHICGIP